jgi:hypothetical protein
LLTFKVIEALRYLLNGGLGRHALANNVLRTQQLPLQSRAFGLERSEPLISRAQEIEVAYDYKQQEHETAGECDYLGWTKNPLLARKVKALETRSY